MDALIVELRYKCWNTGSWTERKLGFVGLLLFVVSIEDLLILPCWMV